MTEIWKEIPNTDGRYQVSNMGNVRRAVAMGTGGWLPAFGLLKQQLSSHGYMTVPLYLDGICRGFRVHRLVLLAFIGECPDGYEVNHISGNKADNRLENLEYCTPSENIRHSYYVLRNKTPREKKHVTLDNEAQS